MLLIGSNAHKKPASLRDLCFLDINRTDKIRNRARNLWRWSEFGIFLSFYYHLVKLDVPHYGLESYTSHAPPSERPMPTSIVDPLKSCFVEPTNFRQTVCLCDAVAETYMHIHGRETRIAQGCSLCS